MHKDSVSVASLSLKLTSVYIGLLILFHLQENDQNGSTKWMTSIGISYPTRHKYFFVEFSKNSLKLILQLRSIKQMRSNEENMSMQVKQFLME